MPCSTLKFASFFCPNLVNMNYCEIVLIFPGGCSPGPPVEPAVSSVRRTRSRFSFWGVHLRGLQELLWKDLQQPVGHPGVQEQLQVRRRQEEQDGLQGLQAEEVPHGRHVQVRLEVWQEVQLVQDPLPHAEPGRGASARAASSSQEHLLASKE